MDIMDIIVIIMDIMVLIGGGPSIIHWTSPKL